MLWNAAPGGVRGAVPRGVTDDASTLSTCANGSATRRRRSRCTPTREARPTGVAAWDAVPRPLRGPDRRRHRLPAGANYDLMAIVERPVPAVVGAPAGGRHAVASHSACSAARSPTTGWRSWVFTVDHKRIGIMYGAAAMFFFVVGGIEALLIRAQLAGPERHAAVVGRLQPAVHDARHVDGVPLRDADGGGVRQLPATAADRCPRRRLPTDQRVRLLDLPVRRPLRQLRLVPRRRRRRRLVHVLAELERAVLAVARHRLLDARAADHRHRLADRAPSTSSSPPSTCAPRACR